MAVASVSLEKVLRYRNDDLVDFFASTHNLSRGEADDLFGDLKRWLWLSAHRDGFDAILFNDIRIIDEFWHTFLLFTADYLAFCHAHFGRTLNHAPTPHIDQLAQLKEAATNPEQLVERHLPLLEETVREVHRLLGPAVVKRWFREIPSRYGNVARP